MIKSYLTTSIKYIRKHKTFSLINLFGLSTGLTVCYFAFLYVSFELSYDTFHEQSASIYRLSTDRKTANGTEFKGSSAPVGPEAMARFPEVQAATRLLLDYLIIENEKGVYNEEKVAYADASLFSVFTFPLVQGHPSEVLNAPFHVVLSETCATRYFGNEDPVGKTLLINGKDPAYVMGVMHDIPQNSHFRVDMLVSMSTLLQAWNPSLENSWTYLRFYTYLVLNKGADIHALNLKITEMMNSRTAKQDVTYQSVLEPLESIYLHGKARGHRAGSAVTGSIDNVYIFSWVAFFVLLIGCLNFINLSTAFSMQRAKEIGIRKSLGATRFGLVFQFLTDSVLLSVVAGAIALGMISLLAPLFNQISDKVIITELWQQSWDIGWLFLIATLAGIMSGIYPAFFLAGFRATVGLKGRFASSSKGIFLRKVLVTSQFLISFVLLVVTVVVFRQVHYMQNQTLGFHKDQMLAIDFQFDELARAEPIKTQLLNLPGVSMVSVSSSLPGKPNHSISTIIESFEGEAKEAYFDAYFVDDTFTSQYGLEIVAGRSFSNLFVSDSIHAMVVNEACARQLGYPSPESILGKRFSQRGKKGQIIGVVRDFHFHSFREEVQPLTFLKDNNMTTFMTLTIDKTDIPSTLSSIEREWKVMLPEIPMSYFFTDENYDAMYKSEKRFGTLFICLVAIAIIVSCLGLLGLAAFSTQQRTKEIGIRRVLGSSSTAIVALLSKDFFKLIGLALLLGTPFAWFSIRRWLQEFAYRIDLSIWIFLLAAFALACMAFLTISFQTIHAAKADPVKSLRSE